MKPQTRKKIAALGAGLATSLAATLAHAAAAPSVIKIGTLYASSGPFAVASQGQF